MPQSGHSPGEKKINVALLCENRVRRFPSWCCVVVPLERQTDPALSSIFHKSLSCPCNSGSHFIHCTVSLTLPLWLMLQGVSVSCEALGWVAVCDNPLDKDVAVSWETFLVFCCTVSEVGAELLQSIVKHQVCFPSQEGFAPLLSISRSYRFSPSLWMGVMALAVPCNTTTDLCVPQEHCPIPVLAQPWRSCLCCSGLSHPLSEGLVWQVFCQV